MLNSKKNEEPLEEPPADADMADKCEYAWKVIKRDIIAEAEKDGVKIDFAQRMLLNGFEDMLPAIFTMAPEQAKKYGEKIYALLAYCLGYSDSPSGE